MAFPLISTQKISDSAYKILREKIVSRELAPGQRLDLKTMMAYMGISATPLKVALARLEMEGLVEIRPRSGTFVTDPTPENIANSFDVRLALEAFAIEAAVQRASGEDIQKMRSIVQELAQLATVPDPDAIYQDYLTLDHKLHELLVDLAKNKRLSELHKRENLHAQMARIRYEHSETELKEAQKEHEQLIQALEARNPSVARELMVAHLQRAKLSLLTDMAVNTGTANPAPLQVNHHTNIRTDRLK